MRFKNKFSKNRVHYTESIVNVESESREPESAWLRTLPMPDLDQLHTAPALFRLTLQNLRLIRFCRTRFRRPSEINPVLSKWTLDSFRNPILFRLLSRRTQMSPRWYCVDALYILPILSRLISNRRRLIWSYPLLQLGTKHLFSMKVILNLTD